MWLSKLVSLSFITILTKTNTAKNLVPLSSQKQLVKSVCNKLFFKAIVFLLKHIKIEKNDINSLYLLLYEQHKHLTKQKYCLNTSHLKLQAWDNGSLPVSHHPCKKKKDDHKCKVQNRNKRFGPTLKNNWKWYAP